MNRLWGVGILQTYVLLSAYYFHSRKSQQRRSLYHLLFHFAHSFEFLESKQNYPAEQSPSHPFLQKIPSHIFSWHVVRIIISFHCGFYIQFYILIPVNNCVMWLQIVCTFKDKQFEVTLHSCFLIKGIP